MAQIRNTYVELSPVIFAIILALVYINPNNGMIINMTIVLLGFPALLFFTWTSIKPLAREPLFWATVLVILWTSATMLYDFQPQHTPKGADEFVGGLAHILLLITLALSVKECPDFNRRFIVSALFFGAAGSVHLAVTFFDDGGVAFSDRLENGYNDPNQPGVAAAIYIAMILSMGLSWAKIKFQTGRKTPRVNIVFAALLLGLFLIILLLTSSRIAFVAVVATSIGTGFLWAITFAANRKHALLASSIPVLAVGAVFLVGWISNDPMLSRFGEKFFETPRWNFYPEAVKIIFEYPIWGYGPGYDFEAVFQGITPVDKGRLGSHPHNFFLEATMYGGVPLALAWTVMVGIAFFNATRIWFNSRYFFPLAWLTCGFLSLLVNGGYLLDGDRAVHEWHLHMFPIIYILGNQLRERAAHPTPTPKQVPDGAPHHS